MVLAFSPPREARCLPPMLRWHACLPCRTRFTGTPPVLVRRRATRRRVTLNMHSCSVLRVVLRLTPILLNSGTDVT